MGIRVGRRTVLRSAALSGTGFAVSALVSESSASASTDESVGEYSIEEVSSSQPAAGRVQLRARLDAIGADGFPPGWELVEGDLVVVDHQAKVALPFVTSDDDGWVSVNTKPRRSRRIAVRQD